MTDIKCPRCNQLFRHESDPKLGELVPVGSTDALSIIEKLAIEKEALGKEVRDSVKRYRDLEVQLHTLENTIAQHNIDYQFSQTSQARKAVEAMEMIQKSRRLRMEANRMMDTLVDEGLIRDE